MGDPTRTPAEPAMLCATCNQPRWVHFGRREFCAAASLESGVGMTYTPGQTAYTPVRITTVREQQLERDCDALHAEIATLRDSWGQVTAANEQLTADLAAARRALEAAVGREVPRLEEGVYSVLVDLRASADGLVSDEMIRDRFADAAETIVAARAASVMATGRGALAGPEAAGAGEAPTPAVLGGVEALGDDAP